MTEKQHTNSNMIRQRPSFSSEEEVVLHALLVDGSDQPETSGKDNIHGDTFNDDILFSIPSPLREIQKTENEPTSMRTNSIVRARRPSTLALWQAYEDGVKPQELARRGSLQLQPPSSNGNSRKESSVEDDADIESIPSDQEVRGDERSQASDASSWDESQHYEFFDTWEVLKDEYAAEFGFDFSSTSIITEDEGDASENTFLILGTSADDMSAQPHVLSPPLMDSLMNFLPESIQGENYWLKFSLVRDGASLETLKTYTRGAHYTILAIETPKGEVFGSFTSSSWATHWGYFGGPPSFVWKMRHSRRTKCFSLFDQAQLESEIDVYVMTGKNEFGQVCRHDILAVGGDDNISPDHDLHGSIHKAVESSESSGFAIALESDLCVGSTSPSDTFKNPGLCGPGNKTHFFDVAGLEVWTFTPCRDVKAAQRLELSQFFIHESARAQMSPGSSNTFSSQDLSLDKFYQRVGDDTEAEERRSRWQYTNMMNSGENRAPKGFGASPRFGFS